MKKVFTITVERDPESGWLVGEAIMAYLKVAGLEEPLPSFVGTWQVEGTA